MMRDRVSLPCRVMLVLLPALWAAASTAAAQEPARSLAERYGAWFRAVADPTMPEALDVDEMPIRR